MPYAKVSRIYKFRILDMFSGIGGLLLVIPPPPVEVLWEGSVEGGPVTVSLDLSADA